MEYYSLNNYLKDTFGQKVYKLALDGGFTCPNRDGKIGTGGCIFCSGMGSGDFTPGRSLSITEQIELAKEKVASKMSGKDNKYIAYFQAFTNTYAPVDRLREVYMEAVGHPDIVAISIATRPDCLGDDVLALLKEINDIIPVWVELGLQTIHESTARYIRRGYDLSVYESAVRSLHALGIHVITHVIIGLPGETVDDMLATVDYVGRLAGSLEPGVNSLPTASGSLDSGVHFIPAASGSAPHLFGIKLQLLHVIEGTDLANEYKAGQVKTLTMEEYTDIIAECISILPPGMVIHRMTGDGDKKTLIAPLWSGDKKRVLNELNHKIGRKERKNSLI